ncbi:hypothetical protein C8R47DRAFT_1066535 [Mycena vitilis]|nr:hypothetical protein C8R47DRAFT_1066535 [Mycena vitilis]
MAPKTWATADQLVFLHSLMPRYQTAKRDKKSTSLTRFWDFLHDQWDTRWPGLTIPVPEDDALPDPEAVARANGVRAAVALLKKRQHEWFRNTDYAIIQGKASGAGAAARVHSLFDMLKEKKSTRPLRGLEMYQKLYALDIRSEADMRGYKKMVEEADGIRAAALAARHAKLLTPEQLEACEEKDAIRLKKLRADRMSLWMRTSTEMYKGLEGEAKVEIEEALKEANARRKADSADAAEDDERSAAQFQHAIDQIGAVIAALHAMIKRECGWVGFTMVGGPMPRRDGQNSAKTICFGETPLGCDFAASVPDFDGTYKAPFHMFLRRVFDDSVCDSRALDDDLAPAGLPPVQQLDDLIQIDELANENETSRPANSVPAKSRGSGSKKKNSATPTNPPAVPAPHAVPAASAVPSSLPATPTRSTTPSTTTPSCTAASEPDMHPSLGPQSVRTTFSAPALELEVAEMESLLASMADSSMGLDTEGRASWGENEVDLDPFGSAAAATLHDEVNGLRLRLPEAHDNEDMDEQEQRRVWEQQMQGMRNEAAVMRSEREQRKEREEEWDRRRQEREDDWQDVQLRARPTARPIYAGSAFDSDRHIGNLDPRPSNYAPSVLFQAFHPVSPSQPRALAGFSAGPSFSAAGTGAADVESAALSSEPAVLSEAPHPPMFSNGRRSAFSKGRAAAFANSGPSDRASPLDIFKTIVHNATPSASGTAPGSAADITASFIAVSAPTSDTTSSSTTHTPAPSAPPTPPLAPAAAGPRYIQSRPRANIPPGHALAPPKKPSAAQKRKDAEAGLAPGGGSVAQKRAPPRSSAAQKRKDAEAAQAGLVAGGGEVAQKRAPGRPRKATAGAGAGDDNGAGGSAPPANENVAPQELPPMTEAARTETARINADAARLRKDSAVLRERERVRDQAVVEQEQAAAAERRRVHNPAGGADLVIFGSRPADPRPEDVVIRRTTRNPKVTVHFDQTAAVLPVKRKRATADEMTDAADKVLVAALKGKSAPRNATWVNRVQWSGLVWLDLKY